MKTTKRKFDAVAASRRWKEDVARQTQGMTRAEVLAYFNRERSVAALEDAHETAEESCVVRETAGNVMSAENEILTEIRCIRDEHAKECGYDVHRMFEELRAETAQLKAEGWKVVSFAPEQTAVVREEPPKP